MGSFSNGTQGMIYQSDYCENCVNYRDLKDGRGYGCAIWDMHLLEASGNPMKTSQKTLDLFIPRKEGCNEACVMYLTIEDVKKDIEQLQIEQNLSLF